jgi:hypothetical protein
MKITNNFGVDLPLAVWLLQDGYNSGASEAPEGELISVTTMMKPTKQLILQRQVDYAATEMDVSEMVARRVGHGLHDSIERAWTEGDWQGAMRKLHYPQRIIDQVRINPDPKTLKKDDIPIYLEKRGFKQFDGLVITGQMDFLIGNSYRDFKTTSTFAWTSDNKDQDYILQGSLYRWIMPEYIKNDVMRIEFIFTDWLKYRAKMDPKYPQAKVAHREYPLMSLADTEQWVVDKIAHIKSQVGKPQDQMEPCTDKQLWRADDTYKYYSKPETAKAGGRCTKRFKSATDAELHRQSKGGKGVVITDHGEVKACTYCPAFPVCEQRKQYFADDGESIQ